MASTETFTATRYINALIETVREQVGAYESLLEGTGITMGQLSAPDGYIATEQVDLLLANVEVLTGNQNIGLALGDRLNMCFHGSLGYAALTAESFGDAMRTVEQYFPLLTTVLRIKVLESHESVIMEISSAGLVSEATERFFLQTMISCHYSMINYLFDDGIKDLVVELACQPFPDNLLPTTHPGLDVQFAKPKNRVIFPASMVALSQPLADVDAYANAVQECRIQLEKRQALNKFGNHIYEELMLEKDSLPTLEQIAKKLHLSSRTVRRRLESENICYRELVDRACFEKAVEWLRKDEMPITQVAYQLGYNDCANFTRAFKRISGKTPSEFVAMK